MTQNLMGNIVWTVLDDRPIAIDVYSKSNEKSDVFTFIDRDEYYNKLNIYHGVYTRFHITFITGFYQFLDGEKAQIWIQKEEEAGIPVLTEQLDEKTGQMLFGYFYGRWGRQDKQFYGIMNSHGKFIYISPNLSEKYKLEIDHYWQPKWNKDGSDVLSYVDPSARTLH